jgi:hypothetical protein
MKTPRHNPHPRASFAYCVAHRESVQALAKIASDFLNLFPRGPLGLTPDDVKKTQEWKAARAQYDDAAHGLKIVNAYLVRHYRKELRDARNAKQAAKIAKIANKELI